MPSQSPCVPAATTTPSSGSRSWKGLRIVALIFILIAGGAFMTLYLASRPTLYRFPFAKVEEPAEVRALTSLLDRLNSIDAWTPECVKPATLDVLTAYVRLPANAGRPMKSLLRAGEGPESKLNGALQWLMDELTDEEFHKLADLPPDLHRNALEKALRQSLARRQQEAREKLFLGEEYVRIGTKHSFPARPTPPGWVARLGGRVFGRDRTDVEIWHDAFLQQAMETLLPVARWYDELSTCTEVGWADASGKAIVGRRGLAADPVSYAGLLSSKMDVTFSFRESFALGEGDKILKGDHAYDTGVRVFRTPVRPDVSRKPVLGLPLAEPVVARDVLEKTLHQLSLPEAFRIGEASASAGTEADAALRLEFTLKHAEIDSCENKGTLVLGPSANLRKQVETLRTEALKSLREGLALCKTFRGYRAEFAGSSPFACTLSIGPELRLSVTADSGPDGRIDLTGRFALEEEDALMRLLTRDVKESRDLAPFFRLESWTLTEEGKRLRGTLKVVGKDIGMSADLTGIPWDISPEGSGDIRLSDVHKAYLAACMEKLRDRGRALAKDGKAPPVIDPGVLRTKMETAIDEVFPRLKGSVKVTATSGPLTGAWVRLGLALDDWPLLDLGAFRVDDMASLGVLAKKMLSEGHLTKVGAWKLEGGHPRLGKVHATIEKWDPEKVEARLRCTLPLKMLEKKLVWEEEVKRDPDPRAVHPWWRAGEDWLNEKLEPQLVDLERGVHNLFADLGWEAHLKIDRHAFGTNRWLRLRPPALYVSGKFKIPFLPFELALGHTRIDEAGIHLPEDWKLALRGTFPLGKLALSDPGVHIQLSAEQFKKLRAGEFKVLREARLGISCKITPTPGLRIRPEGPDLATFSEVEKQQLLAEYGMVPGERFIRWDNPWLHVVYLEAELGGRLSTSQFHAQGQLVVLNDHCLGRGKLQVDLLEKELLGLLEAGWTGDPWLPSLKGELLWRHRDGLRVDGEAQVVGIDIAAKFFYATDRKPAQLGLIGAAALPVLGFVKLTGECDVEFKKPRAEASTGINLGPLGRWHCKAEISRDGLKLWLYRELDDGKMVSFLYEAPDASLLTEDALRREAGRVLEDAKGPVAATPEEKKILDRLTPPRAETPVAPPGERVETTPPVRGEVAEGLTFFTDLGAEIKDGVYRIFEKKGGRDVLRIPAEKDLLDALIRCESVWIWGHKEARHLLIYHVEKHRVFRMECPNPHTAGIVRDETAAYSRLPLFPKPADAVGLHRHRAAQRCGAVYAELTSLGIKCSEPTTVREGFLVSFPFARRGGITRHVFTWASKGKDHDVDIDEDLVPAAMRLDPFWTQLMELAPPPGAQILATGTPEAPILGFARPVGPDHLELFADPRRAPEEKLVLEHSVRPGSLAKQDAAAYLFAVLHARSMPWEGAEAISGPQGVVVAGKTGWWLTATPDVTVPVKTFPAFVSREVFIAWEHESNRFLPKFLKNAAARREIGRLILARTLVADWEEVRSRRGEDWGANPFGLFLSLSHLPAGKK